VFLRLQASTRWLLLSANGNSGSARSRAERLARTNVLISIDRVDAGIEYIHLDTADELCSAPQVWHLLGFPMARVGSSKPLL
jgi:hypothetical protein